MNLQKVKTAKVVCIILPEENATTPFLNNNVIQILILLFFSFNVRIQYVRVSRPMI